MRVRRGVQGVAIDDDSGAGDELEVDALGGGLDEHRAMIGVVPHLAARDGDGEVVARRAPEAVHEVGKAVAREPLVEVVVTADHGIGSPRRERPLHPAGRSMGAGRVGRVVKVNDPPRGGRGGQAPLQPRGLDGVRGHPVRLVGVAVQGEEVHGPVQFQGGLNWYRSRTGGAFESELELFAGRTIDVPSIFISGQSDWGTYQRPGAFERMQDTACTRMVGCHLLEGAGHWVQQEQPARVIELLLDFLKRQAT
jgi:pimeloyl-ACP methyl ester carboxylesterase